MPVPRWMQETDKFFKQRTSPVVRGIIYVNLGLWILTILLAIFTGLRGQFLANYLHLFACTPMALLRGWVWQLFTYMWIHIDLFHLFFNMLMLFFFGNAIESRFGRRQFFFFYIVCGMGAALFYSIMLLVHGYPANSSITMIGASGATYGVLFAFSHFYPDQKVLVWFTFPVKVRTLIWVVIGISVLIPLQEYAFQSRTDNIAHLAHLAGIGVAFLWIKFPEWKNRGRGPRKVTEREWRDLFGQ